MNSNGIPQIMTEPELRSNGFRKLGLNEFGRYIDLDPETTVALIYKRGLHGLYAVYCTARDFSGRHGNE